MPKPKQSQVHFNVTDNELLRINRVFSAHGSKSIIIRKLTMDFVKAYEKKNNFPPIQEEE